MRRYKRLPCRSGALAAYRRLYRLRDLFLFARGNSFIVKMNADRTRQMLFDTMTGQAGRRAP